MVGEVSPSLPRELAFLFHMTYSGFSALVAGSAIYLIIRRQSLQDLNCLTIFPDSQGFPKFLGGLLHDCE